MKSLCSSTTTALNTSTTQSIPISTLMSATSTSLSAPVFMVTSLSTSDTQSALTTTTQSPSTMQSTLTSPVQSAFPSSVQSASILTPTTAASSASSLTSDDSVTPTVNASNVFSFSSQLPIDPEQLKFHIGESPNKACHHLASRSPSSVTITPVPSSKPASSAGLFGSEVVSEASRAPGRFKFQTATPAAGDRRLATRRDFTSPPTRPAPAARTQPHGNSGQAQRIPYLPMLGPDVVIRPISSNQRRTSDRSPKLNSHSHPRLQDSEIFQILAGYRNLKDEVASLKVQLVNSQTLMEEILNSFSSEVAKINVRLTALEQGRTGHGPGRIEQGQRKTEHGQGRTEHDQRITGYSQEGIEHEQGTIEQNRSNVDEAGDRESDEQEGLNAELENLTLTKKE